METDYLFVYGSLRRCADTPMSRWLDFNATWVGQGQVNGQLYYLGSYPALLLDDSLGLQVVGDIFQWPHDQGASLLAYLDDYEGIVNHAENNEYNRVTTRVTHAAGHLLAYVYVFNRELSSYHHKQLIPGGDYCQFLSGHKKSPA